MGVKQLRYLSYLLRLWQVHSNGMPVWRASLENPHTGERQGFATLEQLFDFLSEQIEKPVKSSEKTQVDESLSNQI